MKLIYADNSATTKMSNKALNEMMMCAKNVWGNPSSNHSIGHNAFKMLGSARERVANCIGAKSNEIYFTSGGSEADNQAIISVARSSEGKHIISSKFEHHAVLHTLEKLQGEGYEVTLLDVPKNGIIEPSQVADAIREDTCLVTIMYANNEIGTIQPIAEIGKICREKGVLFHTDAVQAVGHIPIDVNTQNIDMMSASAHKFHGAKGIGFLYARSGVPLYSIINGGGQEHGKRAGTENLPAIMSMVVALEESCENMKENANLVKKLRDLLICRMLEIPNGFLNGDVVKRLPNNINFTFCGAEGDNIVKMLNNKGICISTGSACTSNATHPSHVLEAIGLPSWLAHCSIRISIDETNTEKEIMEIAKAVKESVEWLRGERNAC